MTLIKSISGIRGTIGGRTGDTLNPLDIVKFTSAYAISMDIVMREGLQKPPIIIPLIGARQLLPTLFGFLIPDICSCRFAFAGKGTLNDFLSLSLFAFGLFHIVL